MAGQTTFRMLRHARTPVVLITLVSGCGGLGDIQKDVRARIASDDQYLDRARVVGDLDGDGIEDAIVSAVYYTIPEPIRGTIRFPEYVLYGGDLTGEIAVAKLPSLLFEPLASRSAGGVSAGDVDGDGLADVLFDYRPGGPCSEQNADLPSSDEGKPPGAYLFYGSFTRLVGATQLADVAVFLRDARPCALATATIEGAGLGDLDGDGKDDFAITVDGAILVFYGRSERLSGTLDLQATADAVIDVSGTAPLHGGDVGAAGDVDGDGLGDFLVSRSAGDGTRQASLVRGGPARLTGAHTLDEVAATRFAGERICRQAAVALGDLDGDGLDDIAIASCPPPGDAGDVDREFAYHVFHGRAGGFPGQVDTRDADATIRGSSSTASGFSAFYRGSGDLDGDGARDLILADPSFADSRGAVYVLQGRGARWSGVVDLAGTATGYLGTSMQLPCPYSRGGLCTAADQLGSSVGVGDLTGDGRADMLVTAPAPFEAAELGEHGSSRSKVYLVSPPAASR